MNFKQLLSLNLKLEKKAKEAKRKCYVNGCKNFAINSHSVQERGVLNRISERGHLYEFDIVLWTEGLVKLKKIGIAQATAFKGFCSEHDTKLFRKLKQKKLSLMIMKLNFYCRIEAYFMKGD